MSIALALPGDTAGDSGQPVGGDGMIGFEGGGRRTTTRLLGGEFPRYQALLPSNVNSTAELSTAAAGRGGQAGRPGRRAQHRGPAGVHHRASWCWRPAPARRRRPVEVLEASYDGDDLSIAFNPQYLLDGLAAIDSDTARMSFTEPGKPALITGKPGPDGQPDYRYLLMPIRLGS